MDKNQQNQPNNTAAETEKKKKMLNIGIAIACVIFVAIAAWFCWDIFSSKSNQKSENALATVIQDQLNNPYDSTLLQKYIAVANDGHAAGKTAALEAAITLYRDTAYTDCIEALKKAGKVDSKVVEAGRLSLMGDCYVNLDNLDEALKCYKKAVSAADKNPEIVPFVLIKEANIYTAQSNHAEAAKAYETIIKDYPYYANSHNVQVLAERAAAAAASK